MENKFIIEGYRFHAKDRRKLLIRGWFPKGEETKHKLQVFLGTEKVQCILERHLNIGIALQDSDRENPKYIYSLWVDLPEEIDESVSLIVMDYLEGQKKEVYRIAGKKLLKKKRMLDKYIDGGKIKENGFMIRGWAITLTGELEVKCYDSQDNLLPVKIKRKTRQDVYNQYPECNQSDIYGFDLSYYGKVPSKVKVHLSDGKRVAEYSVILKASHVKKGVQKIKEYSEKSYRYYQRFGISDTVKRTIEKLERKELTSYDYWRKAHIPTRHDLKKQREEKLKVTPQISIVVPLYKTPIPFLKDMIKSVKQQTYKNWELCLSDGSGENSPLEDFLRKCEQKDYRIKVIRNNEPLRIADNTNQALEQASGDWIAFMDHDDLLTPDALFECVKAINEDPDIDMIYTDEDKISMDGKEFFEPNFKSDFNIDMLRATNYFCHLTMVKKELYNLAGQLNGEFDGAQDYDFVLRCVEHAGKIKHIPKVLYHWRAHKDSTAENPESKRYAFEAGERAVQAHYNRVGIPAKVESTKYMGFYRSRYEISGNPLVSIIIPNKDHIDDLEKCISSIENKASYTNVEYIIVENNSEKEETFKYYEELKNRNSKVKVVVWDKEFNYSSINNFGVSCSSGEYYLFLNNDTEIINENCIEELLGYCQRPDVGAVGARLYYPDKTIQHAGVIIGLRGVAGHAFAGDDENSPGYFGRIIIAQDYNAVTAACVMVKKEAFERVEGFDPRLAVAFNDIDFCLKLRKSGYLIVYNPYAELFHYESKSRGMEDTEEKVRRFNQEIETFHEKWYDILEKGDPYYNPNLTLMLPNFSLRM